MRIKKLFSLIPVLLGALCLLFHTSPAQAAIVSGDTIAHGVKLGGVDLGGKTLEEAREAVEAYCQELAASSFTVNVYGNTEDRPLLGSYSVTLADLGFSWSAEESLKKATTFGQKGRLIELYKNLQDLQQEQVNLPLDCSVKADAIRNFVENVLAPKINREPVDAKVGLQNGRVVVTEGS